MNTELKAGFGRADITPPKYHGIGGFGNDARRVCTNILDRPMISCVALQDAQEQTWLIYSCDTLYVHEKMVALVRESVGAKLGIPAPHVLIVATHTHSGPSVYAGEQNETNFYPTFVKGALSAATEALSDLSPCEISAGQKLVSNMTFVRHYVLDDGTFIGMGFGYAGRKRFHTDIPDEQLQLIRLTRQDARDIVLINWQSHVTATSGETRTDMSADYVGALRNHLEGLSGANVIFLQGAAGNLVTSSRIEEENIIAQGDYIAYGRYMAEQANELMAHLEPMRSGSLLGKQICHKAPVDHSDDHRAELAARIYDEYYALTDQTERRQLLKDNGFNSVYHAMHIRGRKQLPQTIDMELNALTCGDISFVTAPYEMFNSNGRFVKDNTPNRITFVLAYCNGFNSYLPDEKAFDYDCYEVNARRFPKGASEEVANIHVEMLRELNSQ